MTARLCPVCKTNPVKRSRDKTCSKACYGSLRQNMRDCVICGNPFPAPPSSLKITCSRACSADNRKRMAASGKYDEGLSRAHAQAPHSPLTGRFETHINAKEWVIQSPNGQIYKCRNLKNWLREHEDLIDGTVRQAWDGITKIKYTMQGKRKNPSRSWKGWRLIAWSDE